jgi:hypothetical protein
MSDLSHYLKKKASQLGLEREDQLKEIQKYLDSLYPGQCRAASLNNGILKITTPNASLASELRFKQNQFQKFDSVSKVVIQIKA